MNTLSIDIETFSSVDLNKSGVYKYVESDDFEVILFAYKINNEDIKIIDLAQGEKIHEEVIYALEDKTWLKRAYNANFEINCLSKHFKTKLDVTQWECTMVKAGMFGYPMGLDSCAKVMRLTNQKDKRGKALIRYFCMPCKPTSSNGMRTRNLPQHAPEKWIEFKQYCTQDVAVEDDINKNIGKLNTTQLEKKLWYLDQKINDRGIRIDKKLVKNAMLIDRLNTEKLTKEAISITGLENPNSVNQLKTWLLNEDALHVKSLSKAAIPELIKETDCPDVKRVLEIRQEMSKTSIKKFKSMLNGACQDNRVRGSLQFYGANRTGRWAGRMVQLHNLAKNNMKNLSLARKIVKSGDIDLLELVFPKTAFVLSQLIRTAFIPESGKKLYVFDFSAIEARITAWLAGEKWRLDVFNSHGKIYEASAAQMFKIPIESVTKGSVYRDKGKIAELALGYQGAVGALERMGAYKMGLTKEELPELIKMWRNSNKQIVKLWNDVNSAAMSCIETGQPRKLNGLMFYMHSGTFFIKLPSGRSLAYIKPSIVENKFEMEGIQYYGLDQVTKVWTKQDTYGGKLVENIVQAIARDCLAHSMLRLDEEGFDIVMHVHDEVIIEACESQDNLKKISDVMSEEIPWAKGLPLTADGFMTSFYLKEG